MKLGKKSKSKKPNCRHFGADGTLTDKYVVVYVDNTPFGYNSHLHCLKCNVTAQNALPLDIAERFDGFGIRPKGLNTCEYCEQWFDPDFTESTRVCDRCDTEVFLCENCDELTEIIYLDNGECPKCATATPKPNDPHIITGNKPFRKEMSQKFEPLDVNPKELNTCRKCGKSYDPEFSTSNTYCDACDPSYYRCDLCGKPTDWISTLDYCCSDCTIEI